MKNKKKLLSFVLSAALLYSFIFPTACAPEKEDLKGTALAEALLAKERINHEHLSQSFDFLDNRLKENEAQQQGENELLAFPLTATTLNQNAKSGSTKGEIISGSGDTAVYSWKNFEQFVTELHYFKSHFSAGQSRTDQVDGNISFLEEHTDIKDKWIKSASYIDYLMQVDETREVIYSNDTHNENYSVGIRSVNDEVNTTYEYYENQGDLYIRTLATPNRRYEYTTTSGAEVMSFIADNDLGYWRFVQLYSHNGEELMLNVIIMTDDLAYSFRYDIRANTSFDSDLTLLSPDLKYEIARINYDEITIYPGSFTGINELRVSAAEQKELGEFGSWIGYSKDYGYYSTYAAPHIYTNQGVIAPPVDYYDGPYLQTHSTVLDENVEYVDGNVQGLWEQVYPTLTFSVKGESVLEMFDNLHAALAKYDIQPIYDKNTVGQMVEDAAKLAENFPSHYAWNGILLSSHENALNAYREEKARADVYESMFNAAKLLPVATEAEQLQAKQNASLPALTLQSDANVSVTDGKVSLNGLSVKLAQNDVLEETATYVLKLALKKNTNNLEELAILDNLGEDVTTVYAGGDLALTLNGEFGLPNEIAEGEYSLVVYAANAADGIRISKFTEVICVGEVNAETLIEHIKVQMTVTPERIFKAVCENLLDVTVMLELATVSDYDKLRSAMEDAIISNGYFAVGATIEYYNTHVQSYLPIDEATPMSVGTYRIQYLAKADGGEVTAHVYCEIK